MRINRNVSEPSPPPPPSAPFAEVLALRRNWKWAYLSHFLFTFNPVLHLEDIQLSELEDDLAAGAYNVLPTIMQRLLMCLVPHDKKMIMEDWQYQLRRQSLKRDPNHNVLGDDDEPVDFTSLIMTDKLNAFHSLCEWQFQNCVNLRHRMRTDDEDAQWRIEPVAYDAKGNAYWLLGGNRLWRQSAPQRKRPAPSKKRKQPATSATNGRKSNKRKRATIKVLPPPKPKPQPPPPPPRQPKASQKPVRETRSHAAGLVLPPPRRIGTRMSSRLRGKSSDDEWQTIPEEWLRGDDDDDDAYQPSEEESKPDIGLRRSSRNVTDIVETKPAEPVLDDVSELTSLSELSDIPEADEEEEEDDENGDYQEDYDEPEEVKEEEIIQLPELDYSTPEKEEWETICVTIEEWEAFPKQFENSKYKVEKNFYKFLVDLVPAIVEVLKEDLRKKIIEEPLITERKRSSRLALKESVKEAERSAAKKKAEEEKEMERHKRWEARARKEEEDRLKRENMRSARLREKARLERGESVDIDIISNVDQKLVTNGTKAGSPAVTISTKPSKSGTQTPKDDEPWELDCEICYRRGRNLDGDQQLLMCEKCNKWQHIRCHDQADLIAGRKQRNWEKEEFVCISCRSKQLATQAKGAGLRYQPQKLAPHPHNWPIAGYTAVPIPVPINGVAAGTATKDARASPQQRPLKPAASAAAYSNGRPIYPSSQNHDSRHYPTVSYQYQHQFPVGSAVHTPFTSTPPSQGSAAGPPAASPVPTTSASSSRATLPYSTAPNIYMSTYATGDQRPAQPPVVAAVPAPASASASTAAASPTSSQQQLQYRPHPAPASAQPGMWTQQQTSYHTWGTTGDASGLQPYGSSAAANANGYRKQQHNVYSETSVPVSTIPATNAAYRPAASVSARAAVSQAQPHQYYSHGAGT